MARAVIGPTSFPESAFPVCLLSRQQHRLSFIIILVYLYYLVVFVLTFVLLLHLVYFAPCDRAANCIAHPTFPTENFEG